MRATPKSPIPEEKEGRRGGGEQEASGELLSWRDDPKKSGGLNGWPGKEVCSAGRRGGEVSSCWRGGPGAVGGGQR